MLAAARHRRMTEECPPGRLRGTIESAGASALF